MNTNQTIDGVPRELLETVCKTCMFTLPTKAYEEVRALLDAPAVQWLAMEVNGKPWVIKEGPNADKWRSMGYELFPVEPAAQPQPQGEPVAIKEAYEEGFSDGSRAGDDQYNWQGFRDELTKSWPVSDACKLYAEQPAPVAVMSGGRQAGKSHLAEQLESLAKQVYQSWESQPGFVPWVDGGNSTKQNEARQIAGRVFELALHNRIGD